ncbi:MAG: hypothetical protein K2X38_13880 [Gemmataceae bacterium]|nr:hypothetical protein [Gemmataceae bacterium]
MLTPLRSWFPPTALAFLAFWLLLTLLLRTQPFNDPGALWHVRVGEIILTHGFPATDPFTFPFADRVWIPQQWLGEIVMTLLHRAGGFDTMLLGMTLLLAGFAAWLVHRHLGSGVHPLFATLLVGFGFFAASYHFYARPHLATIVLTGVTVAWLVDVERGRRSPRSLGWLVLLFVLWTNLHGGVLGGIITIAATFGWWGVSFLLRRESPIRSWREVGTLAIIFAGCCLATFINPFGLELHRTWLSIVGTKTVQLISEHKPLDPSQTPGRVTLTYGAFVLFLLVGAMPRWPRGTWLLPLLWLIAAFTSIRHGPLFCAASLVVAADVFPETRWFRWLKQHGDSLIQEPDIASATNRRFWIAPAILILLAFALQATRVQVPLLGSGWAKIDPKTNPVDLISYISEYSECQPEGTPVFNDPNLGGFLIYHAPRLKIFMDDRFELMGDQALIDWVKMRDETPHEIETWAERYPFERALVEKGSPEWKLTTYLRQSPQWRLLKEGDNALWFERLR